MAINVRTDVFPVSDRSLTALPIFPLMVQSRPQIKKNLC